MHSSTDLANARMGTATAKGRETPGLGPVKKILVAVDHENHAALATALSLAAQLHAQVAVVYVFEPAAVPVSDNGYLYATSLEEERARGKEVLRHIESELPATARAFAVMREGNPAREIISAADEWDADLIVLGTHRKGPIARTLLGSTSQSVLRKIHRPVLLVGDMEDEPRAS